MRPPILGSLLGAAVVASVAAVLGLGAVELVATAPGAGVSIHPTWAFEDGPPPRVTGGFGEDSCVACHWDDENDGVGSLQVSGLPREFQPGKRYRLELTLVRPEMQAAGFQMAIRDPSDTSQAGAFEVPDEEVDRLTVVTDHDVQFVQHRLGGTGLAGPDTARWNVDWIAPQAPGPLLLHVSALAADGDRSQLGDFVYTVERKVQPGAP